jgi:tripartite-type tricarboxylate transporter receptor subunit TctC
MLLAGLATAPFSGAATAQTVWPAHPVRVMVPYPPAGGADTTARILYARLSEDLGQQFVIENRGGAGGTIGEAVVAKADADGYTLLHDGTAFSVNAALYADLPFNYGRDFDPVFLVSLVPNILVVTPSLPVRTTADVIALAKSLPDGIDMASSGNGTLQHLCLELFRHMTGIKINHVPYRGGGLALTDVMAGQVKFSSPTVLR